MRWNMWAHTCNAAARSYTSLYNLRPPARTNSRKQAHTHASKRTRARARRLTGSRACLSTQVLKVSSARVPARLPIHTKILPPSRPRRHAQILPPSRSRNPCLHAHVHAHVSIHGSLYTCQCAHGCAHLFAHLRAPAHTPTRTSTRLHAHLPLAHGGILTRAVRNCRYVPIVIINSYSLFP